MVIRDYVLVLNIVKTIIYKYGIEISILILSICMLGSKMNSSGTQSLTISGDGEGYYAYLPAIFIYQDLSFSFVKEYQDKHYSFQTKHKNFLTNVGDQKVNKYFPGVAFLWLPFFLLAHILALCFGLDADGYSSIYQIAIGVANLFYLWAASRIIFAVLKKTHNSNNASLLAVILLIFGTNIFYYTVYDTSLTHIPNLFLTSFAVLCLVNLKSEVKIKLLALFSLAFGLILISRPQDVIIVIGFIFILGGGNATIKLLSQILKNGKYLCAFVMPTLFVFGVLSILWYVQCGDFIVYSYGEEHFYFLQPHISALLFSFHKGWLIYSPMVLVALFGFIPLWHKKPNIASGIIIFWIVTIYVTSCWWCWWYGMSFGQRALIDFYIFIAIPLSYGLHTWLNSKTVRRMLVPLLFLFCSLNIWRSFQHYNGLMPTDNLTASTYFKTLFDYRPNLSNQINYDRITVKVLSEKIVDQSVPSSDMTSILSSQNQFVNLVVWNKSLKTNNAQLFVDVMVMAETPVDEAVLVCHFLSDDSTVLYTEKPVLNRNNWQHVQLLVAFPKKYSQAKVYLWNRNGNDSVIVGSYKIEALLPKINI